VNEQQMERAAVEDVELEYEVRGTGEPVVLIHAGVCADWFKGFINEPELVSHYYVVRYHRVGYAGSSRVAGPVSIAEQAAQCKSLMRYLGIGRAHIVGHSSSACMALQVALDFPDSVQSLALLETALLAVPSSPFAAEAMQQYRAGDNAGAVDTWMRGVCGEDYRAVLESKLLGAFDQAVADADTFFGQELPSLREWKFDQEEAKRITQPVLVVGGEKSKEVNPTFDQRNDLLLEWLSNAEPFILPDANHLLHVQNPHSMAKGLADFFERHSTPITS
jgi:pimeloyl-ACP methyl ester carboxylesterase